MKNARKSDPCTSHEAAERVRKQDWVDAAKLAKKLTGRTYQELWQLQAMKAAAKSQVARFSEPAQLQRRLHNAVEKGLIIKGAKKKCTVTGRKAQTWHPV